MFRFDFKYILFDRDPWSFVKLKKKKKIWASSGILFYSGDYSRCTVHKDTVPSELRLGTYMYIHLLIKFWFGVFQSLECREIKYFWTQLYIGLPRLFNYYRREKLRVNLSLGTGRCAAFAVYTYVHLEHTYRCEKKKKKSTQLLDHQKL